MLYALTLNRAYNSLMESDRLPASVATLYAELLELSLLHERLVGIEGQLPGGIVGKSIRGRRYLYWQVRKGDQVAQHYLGPDSEELRRTLDRIAKKRLESAGQRVAMDRLAAMLIRGGALREQPAVAGVLSLLGDLGLFRRGAVVVGTQAFRTYGGMLGVRLPSASLRTQDIDVAHRIDLAIAAAPEGAPDVEGSLARLGFLAVPGLDPREPSTSFMMRRGELRLDFVTPAPRRPAEAPVTVPGLGVAAWPLRFLEYLIEEPVPALVLGARPTLVRVPRPGRFALHKLFTASQRPAAEQTKAAKDRVQAAALIAVLAGDRPDDLGEALAALAARPSARRRVTKELGRLPAECRAWLA